MTNYLAYKDQIQAFTEVGEVVKTEEKIAASSIGRLRRESANLDAYQNNIKGILDRLSLFHQNETNVRTKGKRALVIFTSDKGLTGGLWRRIIDEFLKTKQQNYPIVVSIGSKGEKYLKEEKINVDKSFETSTNAFRYLLDGFRGKLFSKVDILYPKFISLSEQKSVVIPFLPFTFDQPSKQPSNQATKDTHLGFPIIDPPRMKRKIFDGLMEKYERSYFNKISTEGKLSEYAARTVSMEHASSKTDELIKGLSLDYRKERRRSLTQKQLESFIAHNIV